MRVELFPPESVTEPRHWVRHDQAFAMMLGRGSIEWGSRRSAMEKFDYAAGDLALCDRHLGEWVGLMATPHLQVGISDAPLMAASDGAYGEVELHPQRKFADPRLDALAAAAHAEMVAGFPSGRLFLDSIEQAMAINLFCVKGLSALKRCCVLLMREYWTWPWPVASRPSSTLRRSFVMFVALARQSIARIFWTPKCFVLRKPAPKIRHFHRFPLNSLSTSSLVRNLWLIAPCIRLSTVSSVNNSDSAMP